MKFSWADESEKLINSTSNSSDEESHEPMPMQGKPKDKKQLQHAARQLLSDGMVSVSGSRGYSSSSGKSCNDSSKDYSSVRVKSGSGGFECLNAETSHGTGSVRSSTRDSSSSGKSYDDSSKDDGSVGVKSGSGGFESLTAEASHGTGSVLSSRGDSSSSGQSYSDSSKDDGSVGVESGSGGFERLTADVEASDNSLSFKSSVADPAFPELDANGQQRPSNRDGTRPVTEAEKHELGMCKPCLYLRSKVGCRNGTACTFCHLPHQIPARPRPCKATRRQCKKLVDMREEHVSDPEERRQFTELVGSPYTKLVLKGRQRGASGASRGDSASDSSCSDSSAQH